MPLRRLLGLSAAGSGRLRRSLSTAASRPSWAMIDGALNLKEASSEARATFHLLAEPPRASKLVANAYTPNLKGRSSSDPETTIMKMLRCDVRAASDDGLLLLCFSEGEATTLVAPKLRRGGTWEWEGGGPPHAEDLKYYAKGEHFVCNPLTGQVLRLPAIAAGAWSKGPHADIDCSLFLPMGLLTQADRGDGPPDRFAVAGFGGEDGVMHRFLSETGRWDALEGFSCLFPGAREMVVDQEAVAFGGRLWWADLSWGVASADPFLDKPDFRFVELPWDRVVPADAFSGEERGARSLRGYRLMGVSEGRLRYAEVRPAEPFSLSSLVLDKDGRGWTVEHKVPLSWVWADGGYPWVPLQDVQPRIGAFDPLNANVMYVTVGRHVVGVDMLRGKVVGSSVMDKPRDFLISCVLPQWLGSSRIPPSSSGKANVKSETLADILVRSDCDKKK